MFEWALGLWPFKDTFYTNTSAGLNLPLNGQDKGKLEHQPYTHAVVAALSGGGVAPGDVIGGTNVPLVMSTCRADGTLLKPTTPSAFIDRYWLSHVVASPPPPPPPARTVALMLEACTDSKAQQWSLEGTGLMEATVAQRCLNLAKCSVVGRVHLGPCSTQCSSPECCGGNNTRWSAKGPGSLIHSRVPGQCLSANGLATASQIGVAPCSSGGANLLTWHPPATIQALNGSCLTAVVDTDRVIAANDDTAVSGLGEVAAGESVMQGKVWKYVTVIPPNDVFTLAPADVGLHDGGSHNYLTYSRHIFYEPPVPTTFSVAKPIAVSARPSGELQMWVAVPILENGWAILGERNKVVPIAAQRIVSFETTSGSGSGNGTLSVELVGAANESVTLDFAKPDRSTVVSATCYMGRSGRVRLVVSDTSAGYSCLD